MDEKLSGKPIKNTLTGGEYVHILDTLDLSDSPQGTDKRFKLVAISTGSGIVDAPAIAGIGTTIMTFDEIRYHAPTNQTGNIVLQLNTTPNINKNGRVQVYDVNGTPPYTWSHPVGSESGNGVFFDNTKNNVLYYDNVNGKLKHNIILQNLPDSVPPIYLTQSISNVAPNSASFNVKINENGTVKFYLSATNTTPTKANILSGIGAVGANFGSITTIANLETFVNLTGLTLNVPYYLFSYAEDVSANQTAIQTVLTFTTVLAALASDDFNSVNVIDLAGRLTPIGNKIWVHESGTGTVGIVTNEAKLTSSPTTADEIYTIDCGVRNVDVTFKIGSIATDFKLLFAYGNTENFLAILTTIGAVFQRSGGINTMLFNPNVSFVSGDIIRVLITNTTVTIYRNSNPTPYYNASVGSGVVGTKVGFALYQDGVSTLNEIIVKA